MWPQQAHRHLEAATSVFSEVAWSWVKALVHCFTSGASSGTRTLTASGTHLTVPEADVCLQRPGSNDRQNK